MAEERIVLTIDDRYCETKCEYFPIACSAECEHIDKPTFSYTRQEAIDRMAKAMCQRDNEGNTDAYKNYTEYAKAAINALLEVEK